MILPAIKDPAPAERRVLSGLFYGADPENLTDQDFSSPVHRELFRVIISVRGPDGRADPAVVSARISGHNGSALIAELLNEDRWGPMSSAVETVRSSAILRRLLVMGLDVAEASENGTREPAELLRYIQEEVGELSRHDSKIRGIDLSDVARPARQYLGNEITKPPFLIQGMLHAATANDGGSVGLLAGRPNSGKTWIAIELAKSIAGGTAFYGIPTSQGKVGLILLECTAWQVKDRLRVFGPGDWLDHISIASVSELGVSSLNLLDPWIQQSVITWAHDKALLILDPLAFLHTQGDLNSEERAIPLMRGMKTIAREGRVAILAIHHSRKESTTSHRADDTLDMVRGSGALTAAAGVVLGVREVQGRIKLEVGKSQASESPIRELWLAWTNPDARSGPVVLADAPVSPSEAKSHRIEEVVAVLSVQGRLNKEAIYKALLELGHDVKEDTVGRYLTELVDKGRVRAIGEGRAREYERISDAETHPRNVRESLQVIGRK